MTHDELLAKMSKPAHNLNANDARNVYLLALRAVAELHKPNQDNECVQCIRQYYMDDIRNVDYPCPTIQVIEKELR